MQRDCFDAFNDSISWSEKTIHLRSLVNTTPTKKNFDPIIGLKKRDFVSAYNLIDSNGQQIKVCSTFLANLLQTSRKRIYRAVSTSKKNPCAIDKRGKGPNAKKIKFSDKQYLREFINKFASYESCYNALQSTKRYLHPRLNVSNIYKMYVESCDDTQTVLRETTFRRIFKESFDFGFVKLSKQNCPKCAKLKKN